MPMLLRMSKLAGTFVSHGPRGGSRDDGRAVDGADEACLPIKRASRGVRIDGVDAVVFSGEKHDIVPPTCNSQIGDVQRLRVQGLIDLALEKFAEVAAGTDHPRRECVLLQIQAGASRIDVTRVDASK